MSGAKENFWASFLLKDKYSTDNEKDRLKKQVMKRFDRKENEVCYIPSVDSEGLAYYFFVKIYSINEMRDIFDAYDVFFTSFNLCSQISEEELFQMVKTIKKSNEKTLPKFGDFVLINKGKYNKLYGVVLRENRNGRVEVGLKFCMNTIIQDYEYTDLTSIGNIFNYIKVLK